MLPVKHGLLESSERPARNFEAPPESSALWLQFDLCLRGFVQSLPFRVQSLAQ